MLPTSAIRYAGNAMPKGKRNAPRVPERYILLRTLPNVATPWIYTKDSAYGARETTPIPNMRTMLRTVASDALTANATAKEQRLASNAIAWSRGLPTQSGIASAPRNPRIKPLRRLSEVRKNLRSKRPKSRLSRPLVRSKARTAPPLNPTTLQTPSG